MPTCEVNNVTLYMRKRVGKANYFHTRTLYVSQTMDTTKSIDLISSKEVFFHYQYW